MKHLFLFLLPAFLFQQTIIPQWVQTSGPYCGLVSCLAVSGTNLFAGTGTDLDAPCDGGVFLSTNNGTSWTEVNSGLTNSDVLSLAVGGTNLFAGTWGGVFLSTNNGTSWTAIGLTNSDVFSLAVSGTNLFAGTRGGGVFLSTNNGTSWTAVNSGLTNSFVLSLAVSGMNLFAGTSGGVFLSTNNGTSWTAIGLTNSYVYSLDVSGTNLFAGTSGGVFLSTNNGTSWTAVGLTNSFVSSLAVSGMNLFAGTSGGVFLSTNNGTSWTEVNSGLTNFDVSSLVVSGTNLFAGTWGGGVWRQPLLEMIPVELISFIATANGKEVTLVWSTATELNNQGFEVQRKFGSNDFVTIGSVKGNGTTTSPNHYSFVDKLIDVGKYFYRLKQIDFDGTFEYSNEIEVEVRVLDKFTLEQNYPNPFNPVTTIGYVLQEKSNAKVTILNSLGEKIAVLVNEEQDKGYHKVEFNGSKLTSGVYFYRLKAGEFISTKKMILLR